MSHQASFQSVVDQADQLTLDEQESLVEILRHRLAEQHRKQIVNDVLVTREEFLRGECHPVTAVELIATLTAH